MTTLKEKKFEFYSKPNKKGDKHIFYKYEDVKKAILNFESYLDYNLRTLKDTLNLYLTEKQKEMYLDEIGIYEELIKKYKEIFGNFKEK